jgi:thiamine kinase-like enzyme
VLLKKIFKKHFNNSVKAYKEASIIKFLNGTSLEPIVPTFHKISQAKETFTVVEMSFLYGEVLTEIKINKVLMRKLGIIAKLIHQVGSFKEFGELTKDLEVKDSCPLFSEFLKKQILKWQIRLGSLNRRDDLFICNYTAFLVELLEVFRDSIKKCHPVFCHGDFDLKNLLLQKTSFIGVVD